MQNVSYNQLMGHDGLLTMEQAGIGFRSLPTRKGKPEPKDACEPGAQVSWGNFTDARSLRRQDRRLMVPGAREMSRGTALHQAGS